VALLEGVQGGISEGARHADEFHERSFREGFGVLVELVEVPAGVAEHILVGPTIGVEIDASLQVFLAVAEDIDELQASAELDSAAAVDLELLEPGPQVAEQQANRAGHAVGVSVEVGLGDDLEPGIRPIGHTVGHGGGCIPDAGGDELGCIASPFPYAQRDFREGAAGGGKHFGEGIMGEIFNARLRLQDTADGSEQLRFDRTVEVGMVFDLINGAHAEVAGSHGFFQAFGERIDGDKKGAAGLFQHTQGFLSYNHEKTILSNGNLDW